MPSTGRQPPGRQPHGGPLYPPSSSGHGQRSYHRPAGDFGLGDVSTRSRAPKQGRGWEHSEGLEWRHGCSERETLAPPGDAADSGPLFLPPRLSAHGSHPDGCCFATFSSWRALSQQVRCPHLLWGRARLSLYACCHLPVSLVLFPRRGAGGMRSPRQAGPLF